MFENVKNTQALADRLKALLPSNTPAQRQNNEAVYQMLHEFESSRWDAHAFERAFTATPNLTADYNGRYWNFAVTPPAPPAATLSYLLGAYVGILLLQDEAKNHAG